MIEEKMEARALTTIMLDVIVEIPRCEFLQRCPHAVVEELNFVVVAQS